MELHRSNNDNKTIDKTNTRKPPEGSWWTNVPLSCVSLRAYTKSQVRDNLSAVLLGSS